MLRWTHSTDPKSWPPTVLLKCSLTCSYTSLNCSSHPCSPPLTFSVPVLACALLPANVFPALTLPAAVTGWSLRAPAHPCASDLGCQRDVDCDSHRGVWIQGGWPRTVQRQSSLLPPPLQTPWLHTRTGDMGPVRYMYVCSRGSVWDMPCRGHGGDLPSRGKRVSAPSAWPLVLHHQPLPAHPELAQCWLMKHHSRPLLTCANTCPMQDRGPRENGK